MDEVLHDVPRQHLTLSKRNGAPLYHDFDTLLGVLEVPDHIDEQAGFGPERAEHVHAAASAARACRAARSTATACSRPPRSARTSRMWIACERNRPHNFTDAGVDAAPDAQ